VLFPSAPPSNVLTNVLYLRSSRLYSTPIELGTSVSGRIDPTRQIQRYCLSVSTDEVFGSSVRSPELSFILTNVYGDADLYLSVAPRIPTIGNSDWSSHRYALEDTLVVTPPDLRVILKEDGSLPGVLTFNILVQSYTESSFVFVTAVPHLLLKLENGQPQRDVGRAGGYQYYSFDLEGLLDYGDETVYEHDLVISITSLIGDPQVYASAKHMYPNASSSTHEYASTDVNG
jgi:hypothetical protein